MVESLPLPVSFRPFNHAGFLVYTNGNRALLRIVEHLVARPTADIQHPVACLDAGKPGDTNPDLFQYGVDDGRIAEWKHGYGL